MGLLYLTRDKNPVVESIANVSVAILQAGAWGSLVVKALRKAPGSIPGGVTGGIFSVVPPTEPCALRSTQPLKVSTRDFSWGKGGLCVWLTTYHPCSAETSRRPGL